MTVTGRVIALAGGVYRIRLDEGGEMDVSLRGRLKKEGRGLHRIVVGDRVRVAVQEDGSGTVEEILPRRTEVVRRGAGGRRPKVVAANVDQALVVASVRRPRVASEVVDRLLVVGEANDLDTALVVNKVDLADEVELEAWEERYGGAGYAVVRVSAIEGVGLSSFRDLLRDRTSILLGPSGVGKSSLLNALQPDLDLEIGELSRKVERGRHTTVGSRTISFDFGGDVVDTPGFSDVGLWGVSPQELGRCFPEIRKRRDGCRFRGCLHRAEPDCSVKEAVEDGPVERERYESYLRLLEEAESAE